MVSECGLACQTGMGDWETVGTSQLGYDIYGPAGGIAVQYGLSARGRLAIYIRSYRGMANHRVCIRSSGVGRCFQLGGPN